MSLRIAEQAARSDVGRQRSVNEDDLVVRAPFFAVADGMGGAKAGEVASALAAGAFEGERRSREAPEAQLSRILREANRRIYELAVSDDSHRGMGTTLTAAIVGGDEVSIGHVGDSRAYLLRDGQLEQLTRDHSLVAELERSGQISPEAAEHHPQRSIITRALGPEPDVEVDTYTLAARDGDVILISSDGLTSMISDDEVASILRSGETLDRGRGRPGAGRQPERGQGQHHRGAVPAGRGRRRGGRRRRRGDHDRRHDQGGGRARASGRLATDAPDATVIRRAEAAPARRRRRGPRPRALLGALMAVALLAAALAGLYALSRQVYFVGTNDAGLVTLYRGVPYELPFGLELYEQQYASGVPARAIPASRRGRVLDHDWRSREDAADLVRTLERGDLEGGPSGGLRAGRTDS